MECAFFNFGFRLGTNSLGILGGSRLLYELSKISLRVCRFARPGIHPSEAQDPKAIRTLDFLRSSWAMYSCSLVRIPPLNRQTSISPSSILSTSRTLPSTMQGQKTRSNALADLQDFVVDPQ